METIAYSDIIKRVVSYSQRVYSELSSDDSELIKTYLDIRLKQIWQYFAWPDLTRVEKTDTYASYAPKENSKAIEFYVTIPFDNKNATVGNGTQISFYINSKEQVDLFHSLALQLGALDEGAPGERYDGEYYAYFRDLDGNKICGHTYF